VEVDVDVEADVEAAAAVKRQVRTREVRGDRRVVAILFAGQRKHGSPFGGGKGGYNATDGHYE
jgi:hypothetical protein